MGMSACEGAGDGVDNTIALAVGGTQVEWGLRPDAWGALLLANIGSMGAASSKRFHNDNGGWVAGASGAMRNLGG